MTWGLIQSSVLVSLKRARVTLKAEIDITRHRFLVKAEFLTLENDTGVLSKHSGYQLMQVRFAFVSASEYASSATKSFSTGTSSSKSETENH